MKPAIKRKWVKALLSGKYKQGAGALRFENMFCCLGVLRHCVNPKDKREHETLGVLSLEQQREFGLTRSIQMHLADLNDFEMNQEEASVPFEMIAGLIDETL